MDRSYEVKRFKRGGSWYGYRIILIAGITICETIECFIPSTAYQLGEQWIRGER